MIWQYIDKIVGFPIFHMVTGRLFEPIEIRESQGFSSTTSETSETCNLDELSNEKNLGQVGLYRWLTNYPSYIGIIS